MTLPARKEKANVAGNHLEAGVIVYRMSDAFPTAWFSSSEDRKDRARLQQLMPSRNDPRLAANFIARPVRVPGSSRSAASGGSYLVIGKEPTAMSEA